MSNTPRLGAPELTAGQAVPETTVNEQARYAEQGAGFFIVIDKTLTAPPGSPAEGDAHIVAATATGAWAGKEKNIAFYMGGAWSFITPIEGTHADCQADDTTYRYSGSAWAAVTATGALLIANNLSDLASATTARTNLGLGTAAVAASSSFLQVSSNLSDLANAGTARTNLGATTAGGNLLTIANPSAITFLRVNADNSVSALSASAFRTAIGAGTGSGGGDMLAANNLSDVASASTSRTNLGLGTSAVVDTGTSGTKVALTSGANTWSSAQTDSALATFSAGANLTPAATPATNAVGYLGVPQNSQSTAYTTVMADAGKHIFHPSGDANARTFTIDSNANVAYPIGTILTFVNMTSQVVTIAITSDTMYLAGTGATGSRSLAQYGLATAVKMTSTTWMISGSGLT